MEATKKQVLFWFCAGMLCSLLVLLVVYSGLSRNVWITDPEGVPETVNRLMISIQTGNWDAMQTLVLGNPELHPDTGAADSAEGILWEAFQQSLQWHCPEEISLQDAYVTQRITITCLDIPESVHAMEEVLGDISTETNMIDRSRLLSEAARKVLETEDCLLQSQEITLSLSRDQGRWKVVPDKAFRKLLSGFTAT